MRSLFVAIGIAFCSWAAAPAADLAAIQRPAVKLPELRSGAAQYCLLVLGPEAKTRVLLAHDGDRLYVDRNGNGDLTEPGETIEADDKQSKPAEGDFYFKAGNLPDGDREHKDLRVSWFNVDHMAELEPYIKEQLARDPKFRACHIALDVAMSDYQGKGIDGRVSQESIVCDAQGAMQFGSRLEEAPIVHFGGPWEVSLTGKVLWHAGGKREVALVVGTHGVGPGTTACVAYEGVIPSELKPTLEVTWPRAADMPSRVDKYVLTHRCCGVNLYGEVSVPADVPPGTATVNISLTGWAGTTVASTNHQIPVLPPLPGLQRDPVSSRLVRTLEHEHKDEPTVAIQFSPDGSRLIAGDYPGGLVHVWDVASGQRLKSFDMGAGYRGSHNYFAVTPDWKTILAPSNERGKFEHIERDGKTLYRVQYDGSVRVWDLESRELLHTWKTDPPRSTTILRLSTDGKQAFAQEETPGEFESFRPRALGVWNPATGDHKELFAKKAWLAGSSADGRLAVISTSQASDEQFDRALTVYDTTTWQPTGIEIPLKDLQWSNTVYFLKGAPLLAGAVNTNPTRDDYSHARAELKFWNLADGAESWSLPVGEGESIRLVKETPDHRALWVTTASRQESGRLLRVDLATHDVQVVLDDPKLAPWSCQLHPGGKWMVVPVHEIPKSAGARDIPFEELPQPHLQIRDVATGALLEDLVAPPVYMNSFAFSPDGNTLATSGTGEVLLWDFSDPPGRSRPAKVGDPFVASGTLVDGQPLDWAAYRDRVVLVTYWATWCQPCVAEIPDIKQTYEALHARGFEVLAVNFDNDRPVLERFLENQQVPWPVVRGGTDASAGLDHSLARRYGVESLPKSFLIDRQGNIAAIDVHGESLRKLAQTLLDQSSTPKSAP